VIKIKNIYLYTIIIAFLTSGILLFSFKNKIATVFSTSITNKVIIIDAGHGGVDSGAISNDAIEKELNLQIATKLQAFLEEGGATVVLTRNEDKSLQNPNRNKKISAKKSDLLERKRIMDESNADIFVSIHMNKYINSCYKGSQVFYSNNANSKILGETIQTSLAETFKDNNNRKSKQLTEGVFLLKKATIPSVIVECGFLSNPDEAKKLKNEIYQRKIAWAINLGIMNYFLNFKK
jgi:N-acetylmuramoyl-L-alanine amidase